VEKNAFGLGVGGKKSKPDVRQTSSGPKTIYVHLSTPDEVAGYAKIRSGAKGNGTGKWVVL